MNANTTRAIDFVIQLALNDAKLFVEEFGEPLDSSTTDWDATAWELCDLGEFEPDRSALWETYRSVLESESEGLADSIMNFGRFESLFDSHYQALRESTGEHTPNTLERSSIAPSDMKSANYDPDPDLTHIPLSLKVMQ